MAQAFIDVELVPDIALPYEAAAETWLDGYLAEAWQALAAIFPDLHLDPLLVSVDPATLADMIDVIRMQGEEPPDPFSWYQMPCDDSIVENLLGFVQALPFVAWAGRRSAAVPAGVVGYSINPEWAGTLHLHRPLGVDADYAWRVPGGIGQDVNFVDIEHAWRTEHEDLAGAAIIRASTFDEAGQPQRFLNHGTCVLGIVGSVNNNAGTIGIAPDARTLLVTHARSNGIGSTADAIATAAVLARPGGVLLIELGISFFGNPLNADFPVEMERAVQIQIRIATLFGITVIEPACNSGKDMKDWAVLDHLRPEHPSFVDSRAIMVGSGLYPHQGVPTWTRLGSSTHGSRVDCFAQGVGVRAPTASAINAYENFSGTSAASAIVAGVACAVQGMCQAASNGQVLAPTDIRRLFREPTLGTPIAINEGIGPAMPHLRKIARHMNWTRILPVSAVATGTTSLALVYLDDEELLVRREWSLETGWSEPLPGDQYNIEPALVPNTPAASFTSETVPITRTLVELITAGQGGALHYSWWDNHDQVGVLLTERTPQGTVAQGTDPAMVRVGDEMTVAAIDQQGRLIAMSGDSGTHLHTGLSNPPTIVDFDFARCAGPVMVVSAGSVIDLIAVDSRGQLRWSRQTPAIPPFLPTWLPPVGAPMDVPLEPSVKPALLALADGLMAVVVGRDGLLYSCRISTTPPFFEGFLPVDATVPVSRSGPVALVRGFDNKLAAVAVGADSLLRFAFRDLDAGGGWGAFEVIDDNTPVSKLGGATAVSLGGEIVLLAVLKDGRPCWSAQIPFIGGWLRLKPIGENPNLEL